MNPTTHAIRVGLSRGWIEFTNSLRSPQDIGFYVFVALGTLLYLFLNRHDDWSGLPYPSVVLPSILGALIAFGAYIGPMYSLAIEREDGTLLRAKAVPGGMTGYVAGQALFQCLGALPLLVVIVVPSLFLFEVLAERGTVAWLIVIGIAALGLLAVLPIGMIVGSLIKGPNKIGTWGMLPMIVMFGTSGIFYPVQELWGWVQAIVQVLPVYWLGLGMRSALLPADAAAAELGGSWRIWEMVGVLGLWAVVGLVIAPVVLRRVARRLSGSAVEAGRHEAMQRLQ
ncbi:MAG: ABC transporter permease [Actinophytocola sp.]|nr:ABC transporter permease [Actinophytocola sp.]